MSIHFIGSLTTSLEFVTICSNLPNALCCLLLTHQSNFLNLHVYSIQTVREYAKIFSRGDLLLTDIHTDFYATDSLKNAKRKLNEPSEPCGWKRIKYLFDFIFVAFGFFFLSVFISSWCLSFRLGVLAPTLDPTSSSPPALFQPPAGAVSWIFRVRCWVESVGEYKKMNSEMGNAT